MMTDRRGINIDLNPMSVFIVDSLIAPVKISELIRAFSRVKEEFVENKPSTDQEIKKALAKYPYPKGLVLPKGSDVDTIEKLFSKKQLAQLAVLKSIILKRKKAKHQKIIATFLLQ